MQRIPGKGAICDESELATVRPSSSRPCSFGDTVVGVSNEASACSMKCTTSTPIDNQLKTVKTEPLERYLDYHSPEENSSTNQQAASLNVVNNGSQCGSVNTKYFITSSPNQEHTWVLDTSVQGNQVSIGLDMTSTPFGETESLSILYTAENFNSLESSTCIRKVKTEPLEPAIAPSEKNSSGSSTFTSKARAETFEPSTEPSENRENNVSHLGMFGAVIKMEGINEDPLDHISLKDRINKLLVSQRYSFLQQPAVSEKEVNIGKPAVSEKEVNIGSPCSSIISKHLITLSPNQEHTRVLNRTLQGNEKSIVLDMTLQENQESNCLGTTLQGNQVSNGTNNHFSTSEIKSRIIGQKRVCWNSDSHSGSICSPTFTVAMKSESIEENCNGSQDDFNKSSSLSFLPEYPARASAASVCSNESGSSRTCRFAELQDTSGSLGIRELPALEKKSFVSRTLLETSFGKADSLSILHTAENLNSLESSTFIRNVKTEPFEPAIEPFEKKYFESSNFVSKAKSESLGPETEFSENRESNVFHLDTLRADNKVEEMNENPLDHISLKDRINKLLVSQPCSFLQRTAENLNPTELPTFITDTKTEPFEQTIETSENGALNSYNPDLLRADVKPEKINEFPLDVIDHILLKDRLNMLLIRQGFSFDYPTISKDSKTNVPRIKSIASTGVTATKVLTGSAHRRKKKRTATDSVETALGEDAPELLQALVNQGINIEELKLYEVMDGNDDLIDISAIEDSFTALGNVISKLFFERSNSLLKLNSLRDMEGLKASYSLSCLISLIQQAQHLQLRKCPVEWGWCRDLQSFIFVFAKHNRIVLERPEYGYATYFFELIESFPIDWQIKRLVIAMKLTNCSRIALMENKSLMVGQDLTEGEARVLQDYGWRPHTGLASMLNFCDRVVHDRRSEMSLSEWKSKIGKLLMNGYDGGRIVVQDLPRKVVQYMANHHSQSKMEIGTVDFLPVKK